MFKINIIFIFPELYDRPKDWTTFLFYGKTNPNQKDLVALSEVLELPFEDLNSSFQQPSNTPILPPTLAHIIQQEPCAHTPYCAQGWVKTIRNQKHLSFLELIDGSSSQHLQVVLSPEQAQGIETGSSVCIFGRLVESRGGKQTKELKADAINILGSCPTDTYPLQKKDHTHAFLRTIPHLRLRTSKTAAILRLRSKMADSAAECLKSLEFFRTEPPLITFSDCEGAGEVFKIEPDQPHKKINKSSSLFFNQIAYLSVSSQLHLEAFSTSLGRVYSLGPIFRAERSKTNKHLNEFWMLEVEFSFCNELNQLLNLVEHLLKTIIKSVLKEIEIIKNLMNKDFENQFDLSNQWNRMTYKEVIKIINDHSNVSGLNKLKWGDTLTSEHEKWISGSYIKGPIFIINYPKKIKPFYMKTNQNENEELTTVSCFDLLVPNIGELAGGSIREDKEVELISNLNEFQISNLKNYDWYLDLRKFGSTPHGGFGIGWDRLICWITGIDNIKEVIGFPRYEGSNGC
ncbi:hypothetical protein CROQUDRAFT_131487 [Cronartium quercuum f. sp. fusiforme G11]|uniref:asparagine--tRNA ligase n=1 Tax=Cronartium quercuum f. sp. fusiforme G11 TaxID=708437 RepID=A0A9P6NRZ7_9BASI|nr:hypothetical protein CROQUDRAFT_131487 [Cronartium quercuum f. sp. fusiforme G11]